MEFIGTDYTIRSIFCDWSICMFCAVAGLVFLLYVFLELGQISKLYFACISAQSTPVEITLKLTSSVLTMYSTLDYAGMKRAGLCQLLSGLLECRYKRLIFS